MKYGESVFDVLYLCFVIFSGIYLITRRKNRAVTLMGCAALTLGVGDAFHLVPRVLNYFFDADFTAWLGAGKLVTSITMTVFYVMTYEIYLKVCSAKPKKTVSSAVYLLAAMRVVLCLLPQNGWFSGGGGVLWGTLRNVPFVLLGALTVVLWYGKRESVGPLRFTWLLITLSFLFYIPVAVFASLLPALGALMLPKTVCYILLIVSFLRFCGTGGRSYE